MKKFISFSLIICLFLSLSSISFASTNDKTTKIDESIMVIVDPDDDRDIIYAPNGGCWIPNDMFHFGPFFIDYGITYLTEDEVNALIAAKANINIVTDAITAMSTNFAVSYLVSALGITSSGASFLVSMGVAGLDFLNSQLDLYYLQQAKANSPNGGVMISTQSIGIVTEWGIQWVTTNIYDPWSSVYIWGEAGVSGYFDLTKNSPRFLASF